MTIEIGDIIVTNKSGFWKVLSKEVTQPYGNVTYTYLLAKQVMTDSGALVKKSKRQRKFHQSWCTKVDESYIKKCRQQDNVKWDQLMLMVNPEAEVENLVVSEVVEELPEPNILTRLGIPSSLLIGDGK